MNQGRLKDAGARVKALAGMLREAQEARDRLLFRVVTSEEVTHEQAAELAGVTRARVGQILQRGAG